MAQANYTEMDWLAGAGFGGVEFMPWRGTHLVFARDSGHGRAPTP